MVLQNYLYLKNTLRYIVTQIDFVVSCVCHVICVHMRSYNCMVSGHMAF